MLYVIMYRVRGNHSPFQRDVESTHRFPCISFDETKRGQVPMAARVSHGTTPASSVTSNLSLQRLQKSVK